MGGSFFYIKNPIMKTRKLIIACTTCITLFASAYGTYTISQPQSSLLNTALANLEALAQDEGGSGGRIECSAEAYCKNPGTGEEEAKIICYGYAGEVCSQGTEPDPFTTGVVWKFVQCGRRYSCRNKQ